MYNVRNDFISLTYMINSKMIIAYFNNEDSEERTITKKDLDKVWRKIVEQFTDNTDINDIEKIYEEYGVKTTGIRDIEE